jgi:8-oxo-dGTP diphosphatase
MKSKTSHIGSCPYTPVVTTLGYVMGDGGERVLMIHRDTRRDDQHFGKYNGLGGKLRDDEDVVSCMIREVEEESGIRCEPEQLRLAGTISWPGFGKGGDEDWFGFIFRIDGVATDVRLRERSEEGHLSWIRVDGLLDLPMWEGDRLFLPLVLADPLRQFHGVMPYHQGRMVSWHYSHTGG